MSTQGSEAIVTGVDKLIDLLKLAEQTDVSDAAKKLNYPIEIVQSWVDFLVEEKLVGIDYTLTKPHIYLIADKKAKNEKTVLVEDFKDYKKDFQDSVSKREKNVEKAEFEWKEHIVNRLSLMKQFFYSEAEKRKLNEPEKLWEEYKKRVSLT